MIPATQSKSIICILPGEDIRTSCHFCHFIILQISMWSQSNLKYKMAVKLPIPLATNMADALLQFPFLEINFGKIN